MTAFESLQEKLSATGLYDISQGTLIYAELMAYAEGLQIVYDILEELLRECFVPTAESYGLLRRGKLIRHLNLDHTLPGKRQTILLTLSLFQTDYTLAGMEKVRDSFNAHGSFSVSADPLKVIFTCTDELSAVQRQRLEEEMAKQMPCWLPFELET